MLKMALRGLLACAILFGFAGRSLAEDLPWRHSLRTGLEEAKKGNRLVMVDFYTDWCSWCKRLDKDTYPNKRVMQIATQLIPVKLNAEDKAEGTQGAQRYGVTGFPAILFLNSTGKIVGEIRGYLPPDQFAEKMEGFIKVHRDLPLLESIMKRNPKDGASAAKLAVMYAEQGNQDGTQKMVKVAEANAPNHPELPNALNAFAATYLMQRQPNSALPLFKKATKRGRKPLDLARAHFGMAICYLSQNQLKEAVSPLKATIAVPNCPPSMKSQARRTLKQVQESLAGGGQ